MKEQGLDSPALSLFLKDSVMNMKKIIVVAVFLTFLIIAGNVMGKGSGSGLKQIWLTSEVGTYTPGGTDPWLIDSILVSESSFTLEILNHLPQADNDIDGVYVIIAANRDPRGSNGINVNIGPAQFSDGGIPIPAKYKIPDSDWQQVSGDNGVDVYGYNTAPHGILTKDTWYTVQRIDPVSNGLLLLHDQTNSLRIDFEINSPNSNDRIHIDTVGTHWVSNPGEKGFAGNPYSHDLTWQQIPEFPTIALPVAAALVIMFMFQRRKKEE